MPLKGSRILILIGGHLATAPRPFKEARALRSAGADVAVRGIWFDEALAEEDVSLARLGDFDFAPALDMRAGLGRFASRVRQRLAREAFARLGVVGPRAFGPGAPELLAAATGTGADLTIVHSEAGLWVGRRLIEGGRKAGVDFEDWFSQDLPASARVGRPVGALQELERFLLRHASCCVTTTRVLAEALARDADTKRVPAVVPNCFPASERLAATRGPRDSRANQSVSFYWFSQTLAPGRGLEDLARALPLLRGEWSVSLRGALRWYGSWFEKTFPTSISSRVRRLDTVPNVELLSRTMSHDVGLALEQPENANKDLTASNKIYEYMRAGLAVIATSTRGQQEVLSAAPEAGVLIPPGDPASLAAEMQKLIDDPSLLRRRQSAAARAAETTWAWERYAPTLLEAISEGLER